MITIIHKYLRPLLTEAVRLIKMVEMLSKKIHLKVTPILMLFNRDLSHKEV